MKNITSRMIIALISVHLLEAYIVGSQIHPFQYFPLYLWILIPVVIILCIALIRLDSVFKNYDYDSLVEKIVITAKTPWVWILLLVSTLVVVGIMWYGAQSLKPIDEIYPSFIFNEDPRVGNVFCWGISALFYVISIVGLYKTLKMIWKA